VRRLALALVALVATALVGCGGPADKPSIAVGSLSDPESAVLAHLYAAALRFYGSPAHVETTDDPLTKLDSGDVRVVPGFTGRILHTFQPGSTARSAAQVYREMVSALPEGLAAGDYTTSAEDKPALAVTESTAKAWGGRDVTAAVRHCDTLKPGQLPDAPRPAAIGACKIPDGREFPDVATLFAALKAGKINAAWTSTAAPGIPTELITLSDKTSLIRAENVVPLYRRNELGEREVLALNEVAGVLDTAALADMRAQLAGGADPGQIATAFLDEHPLGD
jgi:glycine betaine/choline ABC-type transport system substrate-binding protein